jgi:hypothetical protein
MLIWLNVSGGLQRGPSEPEPVFLAVAFTPPLAWLAVGTMLLRRSRSSPLALVALSLLTVLNLVSGLWVIRQPFVPISPVLSPLSLSFTAADVLLLCLITYYAFVLKRRGALG